jgi:hypothetical protein
VVVSGLPPGVVFGIRSSVWTSDRLAVARLVLDCKILRLQTEDLRPEPGRAVVRGLLCEMKQGAHMAKSTERQMSGKMGVRSSAMKQDNSRYGFGTQPASRKVAGASGLEGRGTGRAGGSPQRGKRSALRRMKTTARKG